MSNGEGRKRIDARCFGAARTGLGPLVVAGYFGSLGITKRMRSINHYFRPYGTLGGSRASNIRSFFERVVAEFDLRDEPTTKHALEQVLEFDPKKPLCTFCGRDATQWDHLIEASRGGGHQIGNLVPACAKYRLLFTLQSWHFDAEPSRGSPFHSFNGDAPPAWLLSSVRRQRRSSVTRRAGAPVTLFR